MQKLPLERLQTIANDIREDIIRMLEHAGSGHSAGPLGLADIFTALYFDILKHDPKNPDWEERDILLLSNGHCVPVRYAAMAHAGYFHARSYMTLRQLGSRCKAIRNDSRFRGWKPPVGRSAPASARPAAWRWRSHEQSHASLGLRGDGRRRTGRRQCLGSRHAGRQVQIHNIIAITDRNNIQIDGPTESVMPLEDLKAKWEAFGWHVLEIDGNDIEAVIDACAMGRAIVEKPTMIIAHTIPGKGVDFMEYDYHYHGMLLHPDDAKKALAELRTLGGKIRSEHE